jgi:hypothetical protein
MSWAALRGPPPEEVVEGFRPIPRPPSSAEIRAAEVQAEAMSTELRASRARAGSLPAAMDLEGSDTHGNPWLPYPIPDNPLVPGLSTVATGCDPLHTEAVDWIYCQETGVFRAGGLYSGKE